MAIARSPASTDDKLEELVDLLKTIKSKTTSAAHREATKQFVLTQIQAGYYDDIPSHYRQDPLSWIMETHATTFLLCEILLTGENDLLDAFITRLNSIHPGAVYQAVTQPYILKIKRSLGNLDALIVYPMMCAQNHTAVQRLRACRATDEVAAPDPRAGGLAHPTLIAAVLAGNEFIALRLMAHLRHHELQSIANYVIQPQSAYFSQYATILHEAIHQDLDQFVLSWCERGFARCGDNIQGTKLKTTPLHLSVAQNKTAICDALVTHGANVDPKDYYGNTPLLLCTHPDIAILLCARGADINICNGQHTFLMQLFEHINDFERVLDAIPREKLITALNNNELGLPVVHRIIRKNSAEHAKKVIKALQTRQLPLDATCKNGKTIFHIAARSHPEVLDELYDTMDCNARDNMGSTPLNELCIRLAWAAVESRHDNGKDPLLRMAAAKLIAKGAELGCDYRRAWEEDPQITDTLPVGITIVTAACYAKASDLLTVIFNTDPTVTMTLEEACFYYDINDEDKKEFAKHLADPLPRELFWGPFGWRPETHPLFSAHDRARATTLLALASAFLLRSTKNKFASGDEPQRFFCHAQWPRLPLELRFVAIQFFMCSLATGDEFERNCFSYIAKREKERKKILTKMREMQRAMEEMAHTAPGLRC